jgi:hypothetical protein
VRPHVLRAAAAQRARVSHAHTTLKKQFVQQEVIAFQWKK